MGGRSSTDRTSTDPQWGAYPGDYGVTGNGFGNINDRNGGQPDFVAPWNLPEQWARGQGGSLGRYDWLGNQLDKYNPMAQNSPAKGPGPSLGPSKVPEFGGFDTTLDPNAPGGIKANAHMNPALLETLGTNEFDPSGTGMKVDTGALTGLQQYATAKDGSPWLGLENQRIDTQVRGLTDQAARDASASATGAMDTAASHGGLSGGAAARIAGRGATAAAEGQQRANLFGEQGKLDSAIADMRQQNEVLQRLPGMNLDLAKYNAGNQMFNTNTVNQATAQNIGNYISGVNQGNQNNLTKYGIDATKAGSEAMAQAMLKSGKRK